MTPLLFVILLGFAISCIGTVVVMINPNYLFCRRRLPGQIRGTATPLGYWAITLLTVLDVALVVAIGALGALEAGVL